MFLPKAQVKTCRKRVKWMLRRLRKMPKDFWDFPFTNRKSCAIILYAVKRYAPVAQLDRALDSDVSGLSGRAIPQSLAITGVAAGDTPNQRSS